MGKILNATKTVGKNIYFYAALYCAGIIGMALITVTRYNLVLTQFDFDTWIDVAYLLGMLYSLPILALSFIGKINRSFAKIVAAILSFVICIIYLISLSAAEEFVNGLKEFLNPLLIVFFIYSAIQSIVTIWQHRRE